MSKDSENKICQNCRGEFVVEAEDFNFYEKVQVPPPTWCPNCRSQRRMSFLNERTFYKRNCDMTGHSVISLFDQNSEVPVFSPKAWWSDTWDAIEYGQEYDFSKPFFEQFGKLLRRVPQFALQNQYTTLINTEYVNMGTYLRNCYLVFNTAYSEDSAYTTFFLHGKKCFDIYKGNHCELCYEGVDLRNCYKVFYSEDCQDCVDISFSKNLKGCNNCFGCVNLRNQSYCIFNQPFSKENYLQEVKKYNLGSYEEVIKLRTKIEKEALKLPKKYMEGNHNIDVSGNQIYNSKNTHSSFEIDDMEDGKYCQFVLYKQSKDCYDMTFWGENATRIYECMGAGGNEDMIKFSFDCWTDAFNIEYSYHVVTQNKNLFGCVGLKNKEFCILNKQYTREEYEKMVEKIKKHMDEMPYIDTKGRVYKYGEFFPPEISLFAYNETLAHNYFPLNKEEALKQGFKWKEKAEKDYEIDIKSGSLKDDIKDINEEIVGKVIECLHKGQCNEKCSSAFKLIPDEFRFYKNNNLALPRLCPNCRHYVRMKSRNPMKLWDRSCMCNKDNHFHGINKCEIKFETSYSPDRPEIIYCEKCYQQEVY